ncbi:outer membrane beta-barrel protein [Algoriphagus terrigena]|uniref:outer membrane beta-barrel protein n=1 Tax=Algoriphagus terrigena TaxID=344884 RepID=UPI000428584C|nr:outer membrane beta-barrel protein [Algoriphagus terrigena]
MLSREFSAQKILGLLILSALGLAFPEKSLAQVPLKKDYIVVADTALSQGIIEDIPSENNTVIYFARTKKEEKVRYTVEEVSEFRVSERLFFRKEIPQNTSKQVVFLEKLPHPVKDAVFWRLNGEKPIFYIETPAGMEILGDSYRSQLSNRLGNPMLDPLLEITNLKELSLQYLARTANTIEKPRTFSRIFVITPYVGYSSQTVGLTIPDSGHEAQITGSSPAFGLNGEAFLTFKRNLSLNAGVSWTQFDAQEYFIYEFGASRYEADVFLDFSLLQIPITAKYYLDLKPNKWRLFGEAGYSYAIPDYEKLGIYQGKYGRDEVVTSVKSFEMSDKYSGITWGIGVEKYLNKHQGIVFGLRGFKVDGESKDFVKGLTFHLGYKF